MDDILKVADTYFFTPYVYSEQWAEEDPLRQAISLYSLTTVGAYLLYLGGASICYCLFFDTRYLGHKKALPNQISKELYTACTSLPIMSLLTLPFFVAEVRGYSQLYPHSSSIISSNGPSGSSNSTAPAATTAMGGLEDILYTCASLFCFLMWNDCLIYWIHRLLHHPMLYGRLHKEHHRWLVPTPFASHAFHPLDGFLQSLPYHLFIFIVPLHKWIYMLFFALVNFWTISIHDGVFCVPLLLRDVINGAAHHTDHHLYFNYNLGQYFTLWDRIGGTYRHPSPFTGQGPLDDLKKDLATQKKRN